MVIGELLRATLELYGTHLRTFLALAAGVVTVVDVILGLGLGELGSRYRARSASGAVIVTLAASALVTTPLITAMLARAVLDARERRQPSARRAAQFGLDVFAPLLPVIVLYLATVIAGTLVLVLPGVFFAVSWYFVAQAVAIDGRRGIGALARSAELVRGGWFRACATGLVFNVLVAIPGSAVTYAFDAAARAVNAQAVVVLGDIVFQTFALPFVAIGATLYYLELRRRLEGERAAPGDRDELV